jgi:hypothetical protein
MWCFRSRYEALRVVAAPLLLIMCLGIARDWRQPAFKDLHFTENARRFEAAPAGMAITIPENPDGWSLRLVKRSARP